MSASGLLVVEVSSFQLETVERLKPFVATWLNLTPDHGDRHGRFEAYGAAKRRLFERQDERDWAVLERRRPGGGRAPRGARGSRSSSRAMRAVDEGAFLEDGELVMAWRGGRER